jgi:Tfp pilus assembly protein PilP
LVGWAWPGIAAQEKQETKKQEEAPVAAPSTPPAKRPAFSAAGRRDPFKDLLSGREVTGKPGSGEIPDLSIDDVRLIGIVKAKGKYMAIINSPQGFPYTIKPGDEFSDGFVLAIQESQVIFRKLRERGIPLLKPKDIVKEIYPEEQ